MKKALITIATMAASAAFAAGIPQEWAVDVARVKPHQIQAYHGDTMELKATYWLNGEPYDVGADSFRLYWQTNGMGSVYWSAPATAASNEVSAVFSGAMDPGAPIVYGFLGATGGNYRASFAVRFAASPGATPNVLPLPQPTIDFDKVEVLNAPWATPEDIAVAASSATNYTDSVAAPLRSEILDLRYSTVSTNNFATATNDLYAAIASAEPGNYATVSNRAMAALQNTGNQTLNGTLEITDGGVFVPTRIEAGQIVLDNDSVVRATIDIPFKPATTDTLALRSDIAVKSVKLNGTALTPDANGAVNVQAIAPNASGYVIFPTVGGHYLVWGGRTLLVDGGPDDNTYNFIPDSTDGYAVVRRQDLASLAPLASPAFTGTPTAPTPTAGDSSTKVATTAFVQGAVAGMSVTPLSGQIFDFATTQGVMDALKATIEALGGSVTNAPSATISQGE